MTEPLSPKAQKYQDLLNSFGFDCQVIELPQSTKTSAEAARAVGCQVEQIAKSLVFKASQSQKPALLLAACRLPAIAKKSKLLLMKTFFSIQKSGLRPEPQTLFLNSLLKNFLK